ncbi:MAG: DUF992 domain-containing protein [Mesorhizobium sp.]|uniref:DUF992 domain-containing protein n=1 Tax=Mesorhizobium sp. TaxID=1871066 RepID=UPI000FE5C93A|nr:MAG: DUF992 domain-containing protein [Mesorhizobium sp.]TJW58277.1 MAG: DUF992 domain-containing protein [Mesorhizobium sp.]
MCVPHLRRTTGTFYLDGQGVWTEDRRPERRHLCLGRSYLVGGTDQALSWQPLRFEGETGINIAAGVLSVSLRNAGLAMAASRGCDENR